MTSSNDLIPAGCLDPMLYTDELAGLGRNRCRVVGGPARCHHGGRHG